MSALIEFQEKFQVNDLMIYETDYWIWSLRPHQATLGAGILSLKRQCDTFGELTQQEFCDLSNVIKVIEKTLTRLVRYDVINYLMLMMFDKQVHFHVFPRFKNPVDALDERWVDANWPGIPELLGDPLKHERLMKIVQFIKASL